jgi:hypothetical protein
MVWRSPTFRSAGCGDLGGLLGLYASALPRSLRQRQIRLGWERACVYCWERRRLAGPLAMATDTSRGGARLSPSAQRRVPATMPLVEAFEPSPADLPRAACYLPWLKVSVALRYVLTFPWAPEAWRKVRQHIPWLLAEEFRLRRAGWFN